MGQHKRNKTAILAKEGKLPPKEPQMGKRDLDRLLRNEVKKRLHLDWLYKNTGMEKYL